jgi:hypothetical protein
VYILSGYLYKDPWKHHDVASYGLMKWMADGQISWLDPQVLGQPTDSAALLPYWLGAWAIQWLPISPEMASRVPFMLMLALTFALTWHATFRFALLPQAQPLALAFGGQANPLDYARAIADASLLAMLACLGLAQLSHETSPALASLTACSALLYGAAAMSGTSASTQKKGAWAWTFGLLALGLSGSAWIAGSFALTATLAFFACRRESSNPVEMQTQRRVQVKTLTATHIAGLVVTLTLLYLQSPSSVADATTEWQFVSVGASFAKLLIWFAWPVWPLVLWTIWQWRHQLNQPHLRLPIMFLTVGLAFSLMEGASDRRLLLTLPAMATLGAFALPTLKRQLTALIDWFSLLFFSGCGLVIWVIWVSMMTGHPAQPAANVARLAPGFQPTFEIITFVLGLLGTFAWLMVVRWRVGRHRPAVWKTFVLAASGSTFCWLLLMTLWLPLLDHARSYKPMALRLAHILETDNSGNSCVMAWGLSEAQIAGFVHMGHLPLKAYSRTAECPALLVAQEALFSAASDIDLRQWRIQDKVSRMNDNKEVVLVLRPINATAPSDASPPHPPNASDQLESAK